MDPVLVSFAFLAGLQAFFAPCSIALIPAYIGSYIREETGDMSRMRQLANGLKAGVVSGLGLITIYLVFGVILTVAGRFIAPFIPWINLTTGSALVLLGTATVLGYEFALRPPAIIRTNATYGLKRFYVFGMTYAIGAVGCTLPIFLLVIFQGLAQKGFLGAFINFLVYAAAASLLMILFSLVAAISKAAIRRFLERWMPFFQKSAGVLVLLGGAYLVYTSLRILAV